MGFILGIFSGLVMLLLSGILMVGAVYLHKWLQIWLTAILLFITKELFGFSFLLVLIMPFYGMTKKARKEFGQR